MKKNKYEPELKAKVVLTLLREEKTVSQVAAEYGVHPNLISRWKAEFIEKMPGVFSKDNNETDKLRREYDAEKEELLKQIGQLTVENTWLKKTYQKALGMKPKRG
jgi:transposase-like protein